MPARFASALSTAPATPDAERELVAALAEGLDGTPPDLVLLFAAHTHAAALEALPARLREALGARCVLGCTGESIVGRDREVERGPALSGFAAVLPGTAVRPFAVDAVPGPEGEALFTGGSEVEDPARAGLLLLADPFSFPADYYLRALEAQLPGVPLVGGMASGGLSEGQNLLVGPEGLRTEGAVGAVVEGDVELAPVVSQGCRPVGKPWVVTACEDNLVLSLGGRPAVEVLMETLQELGEEERRLLERGPFVGLAVDPTKSRFERGDFLARGLLGFRPQEQALAVAEHVRRGQTMQFLVRDADTAGEDLRHLLEADAPFAPDETGALLFTCNGRGTRLFERPDHDVTCVREIVGAGTQVAGFFAAGELGPIGGRNFLHGFTASVALLRPRR